MNESPKDSAAEEVNEFESLAPLVMIPECAKNPNTQRHCWHLEENDKCMGYCCWCGGQRELHGEFRW